MIWGMRKEPTGFALERTNTGNYIQENGSKTKRMDKESSFIKMVVAMMGIIIFYWRQWKKNKREGKGLMTYAHGEVYDGQWLDDLRHGYGILEK